MYCNDTHTCYYMNTKITHTNLNLYWELCKLINFNKYWHLQVKYNSE